MDIDTSMLAVIRRLMSRSEQLAARMAGKHVKVKSLKEEIDDEQAEARKTEAISMPPPRPGKDENTDVKLSELIGKLKDIQEHPGQTVNTLQKEQVAVAYTRRETEININYRTLPVVDGLVLRNQNLAETDRYALEFQDGVTFKITDKWSGKSTTIWGDPHVDTSDQDGNLNGEFSDLKESNSHTTLMLEDGTRLTFTARDNGVIEAVDIFKGSQHLGGIGAGSKDWNEQNGLFASPVDDGSSRQSSLAVGDTVYAGGDGNDWFSASGKMVWGQTTGPRITSRPYAVLEMSIRVQEEQGFFSQTIERGA